MTELLPARSRRLMLTLYAVLGGLILAVMVIAYIRQSSWAMGADLALAWAGVGTLYRAGKQMGRL